MAQNNSSQWYLYHKIGDKLVMDRADHSDHLRQHHLDKGMPEPFFIAGTRDPLPEHTLKKYLDQYGLTHDPSVRPTLAAYRAPERHARNK